MLPHGSERHGFAGARVYFDRGNRMATKKSSGAGEYVREEMREVKKGKIKNPKQAIAIGLSRARRAGEDVPPPKKGKTSAATRKKAESDYKAGHRKRTAKKASSSKRSASATKKSASSKRGR